MAGSVAPVPPNQSPYGDYPQRDAGTASQGPSGPPAAAPSVYDSQGAQAYRSSQAGTPLATEPPSSGEATIAIERARRDLEAGQLASALRQMSTWYDDPRLSPPQRQQLNLLLDRVAGTVIYSTQHLLESPYEVQPGERLEDIGQRYNVPWQLLAKINGIDDPQSLRAGERLKVIRGPFSAVVSLDKRQLTLMLGDGSYAGRFAIGTGRDHPPQEGVYFVSDKVANPVYHGRDQSVGGGDANNPLGGRWIGLGAELGIHGTNRPDLIGRNDLPGSISLSPRDVDDVYDILSVGSRVTIRR
jgi:lipoprotein-anchoring transpeptidase ErfK/SrfK